MKYIEQYLIEKRRIKPLGKITLNDELKYDLSGVEILIDGKDVDIFVAHVDYCNWLESKITDKEIK